MDTTRDACDQPLVRLWLMLKFDQPLRTRNDWAQQVESEYPLRGVASDAAWTTLRVNSAVGPNDGATLLDLAHEVAPDEPFITLSQVEQTSWHIRAVGGSMRAKLRVGPSGASGDEAAWIAWSSTFADGSPPLEFRALRGEEGVRRFLSAMGITFRDEVAVGMPRDFFGQATETVGRGGKIIRGRTYDMSRVRYVYGRGQRSNGRSFLGIWDREHPQQPVRAYSLIRWRKAEREYERLASVPEAYE